MTHLYHYKATLNKVVDGDTVDLTVDLGFNVFHKIRVRLYGIDTAEVRTKDLEEKALGLQAKTYVVDWFARQGPCYIQTVKDNDKYGRILANIYPDDTYQFSLNDQLVDAELATRYQNAE